MVEVFKTTVTETIDSEKIIRLLQESIPDSRVNFDLEDCDNILRIEAETVDITLVVKIIAQYNHECELLK